MSILRQNQNQYDEFSVVDTVIHGHKRLVEIMEEKIEKFKELMKAKHNCQFCLDHVTGSADMHGLVYWAERVEKLRQEVAEML